jgi:cyanophycinase-like exopeptidase
MLCNSRWDNLNKDFDKIKKILRIFFNPGNPENLVGIMVQTNCNNYIARKWKRAITRIGTTLVGRHFAIMSLK